MVDVQVLHFWAEGVGQAGHRPAHGAVEVQIALLGAPNNAGAQVEDVRAVFKGRMVREAIVPRTGEDADATGNALGPAVFVPAGHHEERVFEEVFGQHHVAN